MGITDVARAVRSSFEIWKVSKWPAVGAVSAKALEAAEVVASRVDELATLLRREP